MDIAQAMGVMQNPQGMLMQYAVQVNMYYLRVPYFSVK